MTSSDTTNTATDAIIAVLSCIFVILSLEYNNDIIDNKEPARPNVNTSITKNSP